MIDKLYFLVMLFAEIMFPYFQAMAIVGALQRAGRWMAVGMVVLWSLGNAAAQVAVCGQVSAARYFAKSVLDAQGIVNEVFIDELPSVNRYGEFKAIVFVEYLTLPEGADRSGYWNDKENAEAVRKYVSEGGVIVVVGKAFPFLRDDKKVLLEVADLFGFRSMIGVGQKDQTARSPVESNPIFSAPEWKAGVACVTYAAAVSVPEATLGAERLLVTEGTTPAGVEEVALATMNKSDDGMVYWFQISPMRLRAAAERDEVALDAAELYEGALQKVFTQNTP